MNIVGDEILEAGDVANELKISRDAVYDLAASGKLPSIRISRKVLRFSRSHLDKFLKAHTHNAPTRTDDAHTE